VQSLWKEICTDRLTLVPRLPVGRHTGHSPTTEGDCMKKLALAASALAVVAALCAAPLAAMADDAPPPDQTVTVEPTTDATAPAVDTQAPAPDTTTPTSDTTAPAVVTPDPIQTSESVAPTPQVKVATQSKPKPVQVSWVLPEGQAPSGDYATPGKGSVGESGFPQIRVGTDGAATCGRWVQTDTYPSQKVADSFGDTLEYKEDWGSSSDWTFAKQADCVPPAQTCVATGDWYTEDVAPTVTEQGLLFQGTGGAAVNWLHPVTGNIQGFTSATLSMTDVSGYQVAYRFVVNPNAGSLHYGSITVEPYMNGWVAGQSGTFTITPSSLAWSSKIASGPGSQSSPVALSEFGVLWPDNQFLAIGPHLGSANPPSTESTVTAISGCVTDSFVPTKPADVTGQDHGSAEPVCVLNDNGDNDGDSTVTSWTQDWTQAYVWSDESHAYVLGDKVYGEKVYATSEPAPSADCPPPVATGVDHSSQQFCTQPKDGTLTTEAFEQSWTQAPVFVEGQWTLGDKVYGEIVLVSTTTAKDAACAVTVVAPPSPSSTPAPQAEVTPLAETGGVPAWPLLAGGGAVILIGIAASAFGAYRRRTQG
jgi:hypothetical protein